MFQSEKNMERILIRLIAIQIGLTLDSALALAETIWRAAPPL